MKYLLFFCFLILTGCSTSVEDTQPPNDITTITTAGPLNQTTDIYFPPELVEELSLNYEVRSTEFIYCLYGYIEGSIIYVNDSYEPYTYESTDTYHSSAYCKVTEDYLGTVHSHPFNTSCLLSSTDKVGFNELVEGEIAGVICHTYMINMERKGLRLNVMNINVQERYLEEFCCGSVCKGQCRVGFFFSCNNNVGKCIKL